MYWDEYSRLDATALAALIAGGDVSAAEVQAVAVDSIRRLDPRLNAVVAGPWDEPIAYDSTGAFGGVPFALKDLICHAGGSPMFMGSRLTGPAGVTVGYDSDLMARFRRAGLAVIARTATPEFGFNSNTEPVTNGPTRNPWSLDRSVGGSSGGSAALVAARCVPMAHGNDGGGSVRIPASYCGLVGLKPTRGLVPLGPDNEDALYGQIAEFALTRTVRDAALLLDQVAGPVPGQRFRVPALGGPSYVERLAAPPAPLRVAVHVESWAGSPVDAAVATGVDHVGVTLADLGHHVERATPRFDWDRFVESQCVVEAAAIVEMVEAIEALTGNQPDPDHLEATTLRAYRYGLDLSAQDLNRALASMRLISAEFGRLYESYDVIVTPTMNTTAIPLGVLDQNNSTTTHQEWMRGLYDRGSFTPLFNVAGGPAISVPLGVDEEGLPIGVQLAADQFGDGTVLTLAATLEAASPWIDRLPPLAAGRPSGLTYRP
jgi:amidase